MSITLLLRIWRLNSTQFSAKAFRFLEEILRGGSTDRSSFEANKGLTSGIFGGQETWTVEKLGTSGTSEGVPIGNSPPKIARACALLDHRRIERFSGICIHGRFFV